MWNLRQNRRSMLHRGALVCLLLINPGYGFAAENSAGQTGPVPNGQQTQKGQPAAPPTAIPSPTVTPSPTPFVPSEEISAGKSVSFPNDI